MLPPAFYWIDTDEGAFLRLRYGTVAIVRKRVPRCEVVIYSRRTLHGTAASVEQGKRHVERWIAARKGAFPPLGR